MADATEDIRERIRATKFADEGAAVARLIAALGAPAVQRLAIEDEATALVEAVRARRSERSVLDVFMEEFGLSNEEGVALLCLAEALLRTPDAATTDALIEDKLASGRWDAHLGGSDSVFVNASTWALMLTGRVIALDRLERSRPVEWLARITHRVGEGVIRGAMRAAMRILGAEFVLGRTIEEAIARGVREHGEDALFSFDMLGEGARSAADAARYADAYGRAIAAVGAAGRGRGVYEDSGVSVKLSALHPRYELAKHRRLRAELLPVLGTLAAAAAAADIGLSIDAEEADRLEPSLDLFEALARDDACAGWEGLGLVVQAYGKRALDVCDWVIALAGQLGRRIPVRLVKGAYWDAEIKHAQVSGHPDFAVFTQKAHTDVAYLACARRLLGARDRVYPQFATHNAHTLCAVLRFAGDRRGFELQRLHGMGQLLYATAAARDADLPRVRIYAPVGGHRDLLAYLVRRLLENGANSSFVNRFLDAETSARTVVRDPVAQCQSAPPRHPRIHLPADLYAPERVNSSGVDLADPRALAALEDALAPWLGAHYRAAPSLAGAPRSPRAVVNPAAREEVVGEVEEASAADVEHAYCVAIAAWASWNAHGATARAICLRALADLLERERAHLLALLVREAGKTLADGVAEIREAVDFCRYYAVLAEQQFGEPVALAGPTGERNTLALEGRGVFVCISPWNFPLSIFLGQVAAALAAGNAVLAKPAEQTPLVAAAAVALAHEAGVPREVLILLPGDGAVGARLVAHPDCGGVAFTGGTETARAINQALAARPGPIVPLIAETGGQNAMFVDSTALLEQVTDDVLRSAFGAAGQRCSALRLLLLQEDIADDALAQIEGAMAELTIGDPRRLETDAGPVIDEPARAALAAHVAACAAAGLRVVQLPLPGACASGSFFPPTLIELDRIDRLRDEHFGPVLHVFRYAASELDACVASVRALGYGLTLGIHTRIDARALEIHHALPVGNTYVNRSMVGAVVGVQPFGGTGLSGTGPKAGGPHYLLRFAVEKTLTINTAARGGNVELLRS
jgi:RHH-type proline utilization regulon transcriptional repressor/proline dehydrogenase/delta 1-pyrroline-5-carboxylate dehydrogenase